MLYYKIHLQVFLFFFFFGYISSNYRELEDRLLFSLFRETEAYTKKDDIYL